MGNVRYWWILFELGVWIKLVSPKARISCDRRCTAGAMVEETQRELLSGSNNLVDHLGKLAACECYDVVFMNAACIINNSDPIQTDRSPV